MPIRRTLAAARACILHDDDLRSDAAHEAFARAAAAAVTGPSISVGGGPVRAHPRLLNLNIEPFANVDLVATAYALPFRDGSLAVVHCEAVLEHLEYPDAAVAEMARVLRPGGLAFAATPFLQAFHGYPDHFQNFTLSGHRRLFERAGLAIESCGACVGPTFAVSDLAGNYVRAFVPGIAGRALARALRLALRAVRLLDIRLRHAGRAADLCSTTFVLARKEGPTPGRQLPGHPES